MSELIDPASQHALLLVLKSDVALGLADVWYLGSMKTGMSGLVSVAACTGRRACPLLHSLPTVVSCSQKGQGNGAISHCEDLRHYSCRSCIRGTDVLGS